MGLGPGTAGAYHLRMNQDHLFEWLRMEHAELVEFVRRMDAGQMRICVKNGDDWMDVTSTEKPDIRERMWQAERLIKRYEEPQF